ncbi:protein-L-isoaspartate(D-aspartate) O-methyltransferase [Flaviaesturariibacter flavus]|uniref:Protein-L-isoaspartate O-methyltransferase n=1 Tax=Flaviaesturariibacter flavus TaxID=2502780 RepID=A0A4V2NX25_9BACT|nr:protein-L-isoaspartate(D-aspartate) O-methyltransferase [Flaviaesturariibacter flavus]TCJ19612.1 protein-L-isoaspartate(D-aspartate) O-methyltransferase [Flaviaesturariibacter flavus]
MEANPSGGFGAQRAALVNALREKGIRDEQVLLAIGAVPRERFVLPENSDVAYEDIALPFVEGQTVSQPFTVAYQTELLELQPGMRVLEIGTGSGYQAAVLAQLSVSVYSIERIRALFDRLAGAGLGEFFPNVTFLYGDGNEGYPPAAPFDRILLTAAATAVPETLLRQLAPDGMLLAPIGAHGASQEMTRFEKDSRGNITEREFGSFRFVPLIRGAN